MLLWNGKGQRLVCKWFEAQFASSHPPVTLLPINWRNDGGSRSASKRVRLHWEQPKKRFWTVGFHRCALGSQVLPTFLIVYIDKAVRLRRLMISERTSRKMPQARNQAPGNLIDTVWRPRCRYVLLWSCVSTKYHTYLFVLKSFGTRA